MTRTRNTLPQPPDPAYAVFIDRSLERAARLVEGVAASSDCYRIGPMAVTVRTAGADLHRLLLPALTSATPEVNANNTRGWTLLAVDGRAPGEMPPAHWMLPVTGSDQKLRIHTDDEGRVLAADPERGLWSIANIPQRQLLFWVRDANALPDWEPGGPLRLLLHVAAQAEGMQLVQAAAVSVAQRGILLAGPDGSGKSTTALALIMSGAAITGGDFIALEPGAPPVAHTFHNTLKLTAMATALYPEVVAATASPVRPSWEKGRIRLNQLAPAQLRSNIELNAIMSLHLGGGRQTGIRPCEPMAALRALSPSNASHQRINFDGSQAKLSELAHALPAFEVELSDDPVEAAKAIAAFASQIPA
jgi:hypothetical protein